MAKKAKKTTIKPVVKEPVTKTPNNDDLIVFIKDCIQSGKAYRDKFIPGWDSVQKKIELEKPDAWANKEDWQTQQVLPFTANASDTVFSKLKKLFFSGNFFDATGQEGDDKEYVQYLIQLMKAVLDQAKFASENDNVLQHGVDFGGGFMKVLAKPQKDGVTLVWRSPYNCLCDPDCGNNFNKSKWWIDEWEEDLGDIIDEARKPGGLYDKDEVQKMLDAGAVQVKPNSTDALVTIKSIDGTTDVQLPAAYKKVTVHEFWGRVKVPAERNGGDGAKPEYIGSVDYKLEPRVITMLSEQYIVRNDKNEYGLIPAFMLATRKRKFEVYGHGFPARGISLNELAESMVNLGFDAQKLDAMHITAIEKAAVADGDWDTIEHRPNALWIVKNVNSIKFPNRGAVSPLIEILRGVGFLEQMHQDATGSTRQAQGSTPLLGQGESDTLGEYKLKLEATDDKFITEGKRIEEDYVKPLLTHIYNIMVNPKLFTQEAADKILGKKTVQVDVPELDANGQPVPDPNTGLPTMSPETVENVTKLPLDKLSKEIGVDFRLIGVTQLQEAKALIDQLNEVLRFTQGMPMFQQYIQTYELLKRIFQVLRLPDVDKILKTPEKVQEETEQAMATQAQAIGATKPTGT